MLLRFLLKIYKHKKTKWRFVFLLIKFKKA